jgi:hypothetical protein
MAFEKAKPSASDEFAIAQQRRDVLRTKQREKDFDHRLALGRVGVAGFRQDIPDHWETDPAVDDREPQNIEVSRADFPVRPS